MKKLKQILVTLALVLGLSMSSVTVFAQQHPPLGGGNGSEDTPYQIKTTKHLTDLAIYVNDGYGSGTEEVYYQLMNDIDMSGIANFNPIGRYDGAANKYFAGRFDGNWHVLRNLTINRSTQNYVGLFGWLVYATISRLGIENCNITGGGWTGALAGESKGSEITESYATGNVAGKDYTGGLVGSNYDHAYIKSCYAAVNVNSLEIKNTGGLAGLNGNASVISFCYATGDVTGKDYTGGLVGFNAADSYIAYCYATGKVVGGGNYTGGLTGQNSNSTIVNCVAVNAEVSGLEFVGRIMGANITGNMVDCNYAKNNMPVTVSGVTSTDLPNSDPNGTGKPIATLHSGEFYSNLSNWKQEGDNWWEYLKMSVCPEVQEYMPILYYQQCPHPALGGGNGTESNPYQIKNVSDLTALATYINYGNGIGFSEQKYYKLMDNIDLQDNSNWKPIGAYYPEYDDTYKCYYNGVFTGNFDGGNKAVSNLQINAMMGNCDGCGCGLFGSVDHATIKNLGVEACNIEAYCDNTGGLAGYCSVSTLENCYVTGNVIGNDYIGGLAGSCYKSTFENCYATGNITGGEATGGLAGAVRLSTFENCYATGNVIGEWNIGGLVGYVEYSTLKNCVAANDTVSGESGINRIVGHNYDSELHNNYARRDMVVLENGAPLTVTPGLNTEAGADKELSVLQTQNFYTTASNWNGGAGWDFTNIWKMSACSNIQGYLPVFIWQTNCDVGIVETGRAPSLRQVFPNPTSGILMISDKCLMINNGDVEIYDVYGRSVETRRAASLQSDAVILDISHLPAGIYFLRVDNRMAKVVKR